MALYSSRSISSGIGDAEVGSAAHAILYVHDVQTRSNGYGKTGGDGANIRDQFFGVPYEYQIGEQRLWEAAIRDAVNVLTAAASGSCSPAWQRQAKKDIRWLQDTSIGAGSFTFACEAVGLDPDWLRTQLLKQFAALVEEFGKAPPPKTRFAEANRKRAECKAYKPHDPRQRAMELLAEGRLSTNSIAKICGLGKYVVYNMYRRMVAESRAESAI